MKKPLPRGKWIVLQKIREKKWQGYSLNLVSLLPVHLHQLKLPLDLQAHKMGPYFLEYPGLNVFVSNVKLSYSCQGLNSGIRWIYFTSDLSKENDLIYWNHFE